MQGGAPGGLYAGLIPLVFIAIAIFRNSRARNLQIERLWIMPVVIIALIGLAISQTPPTTPLGLGLDVAALVVGAALGWWRGRFTHITIDPATHALTSKASIFGMVLILAIFTARYLMRLHASESANLLHMPVNDISDAVLILAVGLVCAQRLEMWLRASKLLAQARAA